jgi:hypothetical protein
MAGQLEVRFAPGFVHATDPDHPEYGTLTYTPGQLLPGGCVMRSPRVRRCSPRARACSRSGRPRRAGSGEHPSPRALLPRPPHHGPDAQRRFPASLALSAGHVPGAGWCLGGWGAVPARGGAAARCLAGLGRYVVGPASVALDVLAAVSLGTGAAVGSGRPRGYAKPTWVRCPGRLRRPARGVSRPRCPRGFRDAHAGTRGGPPSGVAGLPVYVLACSPATFSTLRARSPR